MTRSFDMMFWACLSVDAGWMVLCGFEVIECSGVLVFAIWGRIKGI